MKTGTFSPTDGSEESMLWSVESTGTLSMHMVKSHETDSLGGCVRNSGGHIITYYKKYF